MPEWFFDDDASALGAVRFRQLFHDGLEQDRRNCQVVRRPLCVLELLAKRLERCRVLVVAINIAQQATQLFESRRIDSAVFLKAVAAPAPEVVRGSSRPWPRR